MKKGIRLLIQLFCRGGLPLMIVACGRNPLPNPQKDSQNHWDYNSSPETCSEETIQAYQSVDWLLTETKKSLSAGAHPWDLYMNQKALAKACLRLQMRFQESVVCKFETEEIHIGAIQSHCAEAQRVSDAPLCPKEYLSLRNLIKAQSDQIRTLTFDYSGPRYSDEIQKFAKNLDEICRRFFQNFDNKKLCLSVSPTERTDFFEVMTPDFPQSCDLAQKITDY